MSTVSVVIPAYNAAKTLPACLGACLGQRMPALEVIVVDDGSTDGTKEIAASFPGVRYLRQENQGPAVARNFGARAAMGEIIAFTDADCVPREDWLAQLVQGFEEGVVAVGGTYDIANPESLLARLVHEEIRTRHARFTGEVDFLGSFNVAYRKEAFNAVKGFDETFRAASAEDNDLAYRLHEAGGRLRFTPEAVVAHYHSASLGRYLRTQMGHGFWRMKLYTKHPRRARRGDRYAGVLELMGPPAALIISSLAIGSGMAVLCGVSWRIPTIACGILLLGLILLHAPTAWRMFCRTSRLEMLLFVGLASLRDAARAIGMMTGLWTFYVAKRMVSG